MNKKSESSFERRQRQRFAAIRDGKPCIEVLIGEKRIPLIDLSLDGFGVPSNEECPAGEFDFVMRLIDGFGDKVKGRAMAMNQAPGQTGCRFISLDAGNEKILLEWLTVIVICGASVRLTPADAEAIVKGRSLI
jgi:hypothetical protein